MGYEQSADNMMKGIQAWLVIVAATLAWLFGGSFREALRAGSDWIWPPSDSDHIAGAAQRVEDETEALLATLDREPEDHVSLARRFLGGDMTADLDPMGTVMASRVISIKVQNLFHRSWSDRRLSEVIRGQDVSAFDRHLPRRAEHVAPADWEIEPAAFAL